MKYKLTILCFIIALSGYGQTKIKDGTAGATSNSANINAVLDMESTSKGFLIPRVALIATNNASPSSIHVAGMTVYNTATTGTYPNDVVPGFYCNDGSKWVKIATDDFGFEDLDAGPVLEYPVNTPPSAPIDGDAYIIGTSPTGAWAGQANKVATWNETGGVWSIASPVTNEYHTILQGTNSGKTYKWDGSAWVQITKPESTDWALGGNMNAKATSTLGALSNQPLRIFAGQNERIRVAADGKVGIGTVTPTAKLDINNTSNTLSALRIRNLSTSATRSVSAIDYHKNIFPLIVDGNGNVFKHFNPITADANAAEFDGTKMATTSDSTLVLTFDGSIVKFEIFSDFVFGQVGNGSIIYAQVIWSKTGHFQVRTHGVNNASAGTSTFAITGTGTDLLTFDFSGTGTQIDLILEKQTISGTNGKIIYRTNTSSASFSVSESVRSR